MPARAGQARNPPRDFATVKREFHTILLEHTPEALEVALDLLREAEVSLAKISMLSNTHDEIYGAFVLAGDGERVFERVEWWVARENPHGPWRNRWRIDIAVKTKASPNMSWIASDQNMAAESLHAKVRHAFEPGRWPSATAAMETAASMAWLAVVMLVNDGSRLEVFEDIEPALDAAWKNWNLAQRHGVRSVTLGDHLGDHLYKTNPPWVTGVLSRAWEELEGIAPAQWLPKLDQVRPLGNRLTGRLKEYGCGVYGCVLPTVADPNIVLKVTTDSTEAEFAAKLAHTLTAPICVIYQLVAKLDGEQRDGRDVYLLWREAAADVGELENNDRALDLIDAQHDAATHAFVALQKQDPPEEVAQLIAAWLATCEAMTAMTELAELGRGMVKVFDEQRVFMGDVHAGNIGRVTRNGRDHWVITDPGHVAVLRD